MSGEDAQATARERTLRLLDALFGSDSETVGARLWDGTLWPDAAWRRATVVLRHPGALRAMLLPGTELGLAEAYLYDDIDIEGDIEAIFGLANRLAARPLGWREKLRLARELRRLPDQAAGRSTQRGPARLRGRRHSVKRDRQAIAYHYDVSNEFYALWLDQRMVYSCAYFVQAEDDLDRAQQQKLDHICRKLRLRPGQRLLDVGCGWGGLVMYAAERYGVDATGITLSEPQVALANQRIEEAGLSDRCRVLYRDYRELPNEASYDALVSVGMVEHVGAAMLPTYFQHAHRLLKPGGVFLNHGITCRAIDKSGLRDSFSNTYVFPDGELVPIHAMLEPAESCGFEVRDVECLREHYALTLRHWVRRLENAHEQALQHVDEPTYRVWRLFMSGSASGFETGRLNVYQTLLSKPDQGGHSHLPLTRSDWYES